MKKFLILGLFSWWFAEMSGGGHTITMGPFETKEQCEQIRTWVDKKSGKTRVVRYTSSCWEASISYTDDTKKNK